MVPGGGEEGIPIGFILSKHRVVCEEALLGPGINLQITTHSNTPRGVMKAVFLSDHVSTAGIFGFWRCSPRKHRFVLNIGFYEDEEVPRSWRTTHIWRKKHVACGRRGTVGSPRSLEFTMESWAPSTATMGLNTCSPAGNKLDASRQLWKCGPRPSRADQPAVLWHVPMGKWAGLIAGY